MHLSFLGPEFLTWLCFQTNDTLSLGKRIELKPLMGKEHKVAILSSKLEDSNEVLQAIRSGYYIESLALEHKQDAYTYSFVLHALDGSISGVKIQGAEKSTGESEEADMLLRMSFLDEIEALVSKLFYRFLELRLGKTFVSQEIKSIRKNVLEGIQATLST